MGINSSSKDNKLSSLTSSITSRNTPTSQQDGDHASTLSDIVSKDSYKTISASKIPPSKGLSASSSGNSASATFPSTDKIIDKAKVTDVELNSDSDVNKKSLS